MSSPSKLIQKPDFYTITHYSFSENEKYYYHKKLNPKEIGCWKTNNFILVRNARTGKDFIIKILSRGKGISQSDDLYKRYGPKVYISKIIVISSSDNDSKKIRKIPEALKESILSKQKNKCKYCNTVLISPDYNFDHILEFSLGGLTEPSNLQALCKNCHSVKTMIFDYAKQKGILNQYNWRANNKSWSKFNKAYTTFIRSIF